MSKRKKLIIRSVLAVITIIILLCLIFYIYNMFKLINANNLSNANFFNSTANDLFKVDSITFFSSCNSEKQTSSTNHFTIQNLYQYTDISIDLQPVSDIATVDNTLQAISISNIEFTTSPELGTQNLAFKSINNFTKPSLSSDYLITDTFDFILSSNSSEDLDLPFLYNNYANPITLSYINSNIKSDYTITDTSIPITYDGSLLTKCNVPLSDLTCSFSFDLLLTNLADNQFKTTFFITIPLKNDNSSILDGSYIYTIEKPVLLFTTI